MHAVAIAACRNHLPLFVIMTCLYEKSLEWQDIKEESCHPSHNLAFTDLSG